MAQMTSSATWGQSAERVVEARHPRIRIAHVGIDARGVDDVEVAFHCPTCDTELILGQAEDRALSSLLALGRPRGFRPEPAVVPRRAPVVQGDTVAAVLADPDVPVVSGDVPLAELANVLADRGADLAILVDRDAQPFALCSACDVLRTAQRFGERMTALSARHGARSGIFTVRGDAPLSALVSLFCEEGATNVVVRGDDGRVLGLVRAHDVLRRLAG